MTVTKGHDWQSMENWPGTPAWKCLKCGFEVRSWGKPGPEYLGGFGEEQMTCEERIVQDALGS